MSHLKMYVLVKNTVPLGLASAAIAHAPLKCYLEYTNEPKMQQWVGQTFYKVICSVNEKEFNRAKEAGQYSLLTESNMDGEEVALAFVPRDEWPTNFKYFKKFG